MTWRSEEKLREEKSSVNGEEHFSVISDLLIAFENRAVASEW